MLFGREREGSRKSASSSRPSLCETPCGDEGKLRREYSRESSRSLVSSLIDVSSGSVVGSKHGHDSVRVSVRSSDVGSLGSNVVDVEPDSTS